MSLDSSATFFAQQSMFTDPGMHSDVLRSWPDDLHALMTSVQGMLIYDVVAEPFYGVSLPPERQADIHLRRVEQILDRAFQVDPAHLDGDRPAANRIASRCSGFGLLLLSVLRQRRIPARARAGFATYFMSGRHEDHWVVEYLDPHSQTWHRADPQFDATWRERLAIRHDVADVPGDRFLTAAQTWMECRAGGIDPSRVGISHVDMYGLFMVAGSLVRDMAALNRMELLPWDVWGAQPQPFSQLTDRQLDYFDGLANLLIEPDAHWSAIRARYEDDPGLKVHDSVVNALRRKPEKVGRPD